MEPVVLAPGLLTSEGFPLKWGAKRCKMADLDFAQLKSKLLVTALQVVNDPRIMKVLSHPAVMNVVTRGLSIKEKIDATVRIWTEDDLPND